MVETLYIIRHGATEGSEEPRYKGSMDVPLSEHGKVQVQKTADVMAKNGFTPGTIYCSDLSRARVSAEIIGGRFAMTATMPIIPIIIEEFRERDFGRWEGMSFKEIGKKFPEDFDAWAKDPLRFSPLDGESTLEVKARVMPKLKEVLEAHDGGNVTLVAHGGVNRIILCEMLGLSLEYIFRIEQDNACLNIIRFYDELPVIELLNGSHWTG
jgi:alpha-ribazole phosphatase/probable phosphoglycerate mutase